MNIRKENRHGALDLAPDPYLNFLVSTAARICGTPIALVSFLIGEHQFFKARFGLACSSTPRSVSFCAHAIQQDDLFVVPDALLDRRFCDHPFVTSEPFIRFYAGMPVHDRFDGVAIGTICVIDHVGRNLDEVQLHNLRQLGKLVSARLRPFIAAA